MGVELSCGEQMLVSMCMTYLHLSSTKASGSDEDYTYDLQHIANPRYDIVKVFKRDTEYNVANRDWSKSQVLWERKDV